MATRDRFPAVALFDIGNVLISLRPALEAFPLEAFASPGASEAVDVERRLADFQGSEIFERYERGFASTSEFFGALHAAFPSHLGPRELEACYRRILGEEVAGMHDLILELKRSGSRVAGLTDTSPVHLDEMARYPVVRELEVVVASCETGYRKPAPEAYQAALQRLRVAASDVFFTDDRDPNVAAARRLGIRAERFIGAAALRDSLLAS